MFEGPQAVVMALFGMEMSKYWIRVDVDGEDVASLILRKPWQSIRNSACRRTTLYFKNPIDGTAKTILCSSPLVMGRRMSPLSSPEANPKNSFFTTKASIGFGIPLIFCR